MAAGAADWVWARSQPSTWQHLVGDRGWKPGDYVELAVRSILAEIVGTLPTAPDNATAS